MSSTYDHKGKVLSAQRRVSKALNRIETNSLNVEAKGGAIYCPYYAVSELINAMRNLRETQKEFNKYKKIIEVKEFIKKARREGVPL